MTAVRENGEADIDVQVQRKMQSQTPQALLYFLISTKSFKKYQTLNFLNDFSLDDLNINNTRASGMYFPISEDYTYLIYYVTGREVLR